MHKVLIFFLATLMIAPNTFANTQIEKNPLTEREKLLITLDAKSAAYQSGIDEVDKHLDGNSRILKGVYIGVLSAIVSTYKSKVFELKTTTYNKRKKLITVKKRNLRISSLTSAALAIMGGAMILSGYITLKSRDENMTLKELLDFKENLKKSKIEIDILYKQLQLPALDN